MKASQIPGSLKWLVSLCFLPSRTNQKRSTILRSTHIMHTHIMHLDTENTAGLVCLSPDLFGTTKQFPIRHRTKMRRFSEVFRIFARKGQFSLKNSVPPVVSAARTGGSFGRNLVSPTQVLPPVPMETPT